MTIGLAHERTDFPFDLLLNSAKGILPLYRKNHDNSHGCNGLYPLMSNLIIAPYAGREPKRFGWVIALYRQRGGNGFEPGRPRGMLFDAALKAYLPLEPSGRCWFQAASVGGIYARRFTACESA